LDAWACHFPEQVQTPFQINYLLLNIIENQRVLLRVFPDVVESSAWPVVESITPIFKGSNWAEREIWDLFGIFFTEHPDFRRILTDYGFEGFPLRKDFPINGYVELRFNYSKGGLLYQPIKLSQDFRKFNFQSPWI